MYKKDDIQVALDDLKEYCAANGSNSGYEELFLPLATSVDKYYAVDGILEKNVNYTLHQLVSDIQNRRTKYEHQNLLPMPPNGAPYGYANISVVFDGGGAIPGILNCNKEAFLQAFIVGAQEGNITAPNGMPQVVTSNTYLDTWQTALDAARVDEINVLQSIAEFCESGSYGCGLVMLFEDLGQIVESIGCDELAREIYIKRRYKELIESFDLDVYVPAVVR